MEDERTRDEESAVGRLWCLFKTFFLISGLTLGGGLAMLTPMREEFVGKRRYLNDEEMMDIIAVMQTLPGLIGMNISVLIGHRVAGFWGAMVSALGIVIPPFLVIIAVCALRTMFGDGSSFEGVFLGIRACVTGLILISLYELGRKILKNWFGWLLCVISFLLVYVFDASVIAVLGGGLVLGFALSLWNLWREARQ